MKILHCVVMVSGENPLQPQVLDEQAYYVGLRVLCTVARATERKRVFEEYHTTHSNHYEP